MLTKTSRTSLLFKEFNLPEQDLAKLSFCANDSVKLQRWLETLPVTRITETSIILYKALPEVCRLKILPEKRISMLESIYPYVYRCTEGLMRNLLRQPLILSTEMMKLALIAQALQHRLNDGYMIALRDLLQINKESNGRQLSMLCLYRVISGLSLLLLRSYQFYTPEPPNLWRKSHALYQLAIEQQLEKTPIKDSLLKNQPAMTISAAYKRSLLLACSAPHQLRQVDIAHIFQAFEQCSSMVQLKVAKEDGRQSLYWVSLAHDKGPFYNNRLRGEPSKEIYAINLEPLIPALENTDKSKNGNQSSIHFPIPYSNVLITHLSRNWKKANVRLVDRQSSDEPLEICVGLTAVHNQLLGNNSFESLAYNSRQHRLGEGHIFKDFNNDWEVEEPSVTGIPTINNVTEIPLAVKTINSSTSGYCITWDNTMPSKVRVGELLGIRKPAHSRWEIGIISWAQRQKDKVYTGVQLLSREAEAYAASTLLSDGNKSPYFRALLLKDSTQIENNSIITPSIPFEVNQTITLRCYEEQARAQLTNLLLTSTTVSQFTYRLLNSNGDTEQ